MSHVSCIQRGACLLMRMSRSSCVVTSPFMRNVVVQSCPSSAPPALSTFARNIHNLAHPTIRTSTERGRATSVKLDSRCSWCWCRIPPCLLHRSMKFSKMSIAAGPSTRAWMSCQGCRGPPRAGSQPAAGRRGVCGDVDVDMYVITRAWPPKARAKLPKRLQKMGILCCVGSVNGRLC